LFAIFVENAGHQPRNSGGSVIIREVCFSEPESTDAFP
jgi:hypothetical protein